MKLTKLLTFGAALVMMPASGFAQDAAPAVDNAFIFNTLLFLIGGFLVFWMAAGFAMLEAGLVRSKNVTMQLTKNISLFSIAAIMYWLVGYNIMYPGAYGADLGDGETSSWIIDGILGPLFRLADIGGDPALDTGYATGSDFFFQLMFCATTASIVSGTLAERIKLWPFLIFTVVLTGLIYPIEASWQWGGGWPAQMGFSDFAGSTLVHPRSAAPAHRGGGREGGVHRSAAALRQTAGSGMVELVVAQAVEEHQHVGIGLGDRRRQVLGESGGRGAPG